MKTSDVRLTVYEVGASKRSTGIFEVDSFKDGIHVGRGLKMCRNEMVPTISSWVSTIREEVVQEMISEKFCPDEMNSRQWKLKSPKQRLLYHIKCIANGNKFEFHFI